MQRIIQQITQDYIDRLPENEQYYRLDEFRSWNFPTFVIQRIKIELERNLAESMIIPKTDWANTESGMVVNAWQHFVDAIRAEARLPASYARTVLETAVADILEILVQPRKNIPEVVFGTDKKLGSEQISERLKAVVVYRHFSSLIPRYMQKKELEELDREKCTQIIINADEKLTARYSPLNWAQMLEPLFQLCDGKIDTSLLRLFFEDKKMPRVARQFDLMDDSLTRAKLIEVLSSPESLDFEGYREDQSHLFEDQPAKSSADSKEEPEETQAAEEAEEDTEESDLAALFVKNRASRLGVNEDSEGGGPGHDETTEISISAEEIEPQEGQPEEEQEDHSLNAFFMAEEEETPEGDDQPDEVFADFEEVDETPSGEGPEESERQPDEDDEEQTDSALPESAPRKEETPMWMRFMSDDDIVEYGREEQQAGAEDENGFIDDPLIDLTKKDGGPGEETRILKKQLSDDRRLFVKELFGGSDRAFEEAIDQIAAHQSWEKASKFIESDIFKRNLIDIYAEPAVEFTDRLQDYFLSKQNRTK